MKENKQNICDLLLITLQATRNASDLVSLEYFEDEKGNETVVATFESGGKRVTNVSMDSGTAMIRDIMNNLGC